MEAWHQRMLARPAVEKGRNVPSPHTMYEGETEEQMDRKAASARDWILKSQQEEAAKK